MSEVPSGYFEGSEQPIPLDSSRSDVKPDSLAKRLREKFRGPLNTGVKMGKSGVLNVASAAAYESVTFVAGAIGWYLDKFDRDFSNPITAFALGTSLTGLGISVFWGGMVNRRMIKSDLGFNPNVVSTGIYHFTRRVWPTSENLQGWLVVTASCGWDLLKQGFIVWVGNGDPNVIIPANAAGALANFAQARAGLSYLRSRHLQR